MCTGTPWPTGNSAIGGRLTSSRLTSSRSRSASGRICPGVSPLRTAEREEPELRRLRPVTKPKLVSFDQQFRAFLHPLRDDTQSLQRWFVSGHCRHRGLQADIIGPRRSCLDAHALARGAVSPVERSPICDGEVWIETLQFADWLSLVPVRQQIKHTVADGRGLENTSIEKTAVGASKSAPGPKLRPGRRASRLPSRSAGSE